jgi:hypothetical protein
VTLVADFINGTQWSPVAEIAFFLADMAPGTGTVKRFPLLYATPILRHCNLCPWGFR